MGVSASVPGHTDAAAETFRHQILRYAGPAGYPKAEWLPLSAAERRQLPSGAAWAAADGLDSTAIRPPSCQLALLEYLSAMPILIGPDWPAGLPPGSNIHTVLLNM